MENLVKSRAACRGWVTREGNALSAILDSKGEARVSDLTFRLSEFEKRLAALDVAQSKVEQSIDSSDDLERDIDTAFEFRNKYLDIKRDALAAISWLEASHGCKKGAASGGSSVKAKLPKLEIAVFKGEFTTWQSFWDQFSAIVDNSDLPKISKFSYLRSLCAGEALDAIKGLSLTEDNYELACRSLKERFGRPERIIFAHIQALLNMSVPSSNSLSVTQLWKIRDEINIHVRCLQTLGVGGDKYGLFLTPLILSKLPLELRMEWARDSSGKEGDLLFLLNFLTSEIERRERCEGFKNPKPCVKSPSVHEERKPSSFISETGTASALQTSSSVTGNKVSCVFCGKPHNSVKCWDLPKLTVQTRYEKVKNSGACFRCLARNHVARGCLAKCNKCKGGHHELLCNPQKTSDSVNVTGAKKVYHVSGAHSGGKSQNVVEKRAEVVSTEKICNKPLLSHVKVSGCVERNRTVLQTAKVLVQGPTSVVTATLMFDTGSDNTYVSSALVKKVSPLWVTSRLMSYAAFGSGKSTASQVHNVYKLNVQSKKGHVVNVNAVEVKTISAPLYRPKIPDHVLQSVSCLELADELDDSGEVSIDILVGLDQYWNLMKTGSQVLQLSEGLVAQETVFGWVLSGSFKENYESDNAQSFGSHSVTLYCQQLLSLSDIPDGSLVKFWDLESVGISSDSASSTDDKVLQSFNETVKFVDGRYEVHLPWKESVSPLNLLNNRKLAEVRMSRLKYKLSKDPILLSQYSEALTEMEKLGFITEVESEEMASDRPVFYMPHRPVTKEASLTTKVRPVFDASAKGLNHISLNDCMEAGPSLVPRLVDVLIRFRRWRIGLVTDITKAFLQIRVCEKDQDVHRFLWSQNGQTRVMKILRVPFGNTSSPFLLNATIRHHLAQYPVSEVTEDLEDNLFVDDWITGRDYEDKVCMLYQDGEQILKEGGFPLAKCASNSDAVNELFFREFGVKHLDADVTKILGLKWLKKQDCFCFDGVKVPTELVTTKRVVLSLLARLYDPLGLLNPFVMVAKIIVQDIWVLKLDWDVEVLSEIHGRFLKWVDGLSLIQNWRIPRCYSTSPWSTLHGIELHCFGDASQRGYGACAYIRIPHDDGTFEVSLISSRSRVAPLTEISLPRLELLGALLCARLLQSVRTALKLPDVPGFCWTDSMVVLGWVKGRPCRWKTFVANRVNEIQKLTSPSQWSHCPGKGNPADLLTRGVYAEQLIESSQWLNGPDWLSQPINPPTDERLFEHVERLLQSEMIPVSTVLVAKVWMPEKVLEIERWSSLRKAMGVTSWVLRFIRNCRNPCKLHGELSIEELDQAKHVLVEHTQCVTYGTEIDALKEGKIVAKSSPLSSLSPVMGNDGLVRIGGRLHNTDLSYAEKHPVILPKCQLSVLLIRAEHVRLKHAGVDTVLANIRDTYWIIGARRLAKSVKKGCFHCQILDALACNQVAAPLPELRVHEAPVFTVTGLDNAGPLYCLDFPGKKYYILLFTCAVVRAVHLELVESLEIPDCVLALRRFFARRGVPSILYSDNASTFKGTEQLMIKVYGTVFPKWKNILPKSPWWGGWWERLVQSVKRALKKTVGNRWLTKIELETTLCEIEACVNCRPLTFVGDEVDCSKPLTPSHFLLGRNVGFQTVVDENEVEVKQDHLSESELIRQRRLELFWSVWSKDYLRNLPPAVNKFQAKGNIGLGSVVLIREDNLSRMRWPLGVVTKLLPGKDGQVRAVELKTSKGFLKRPVQRLHDLEVSTELKSHQSSDVNIGGVSSDVISDGQSSTDLVDQRQKRVKVTRYGRVSKPKKRLDCSSP